MESENETCGVCSIPYDSDNHIPRVLVNCGHTLCSSCLKEIVNNPNQRKCPFDLFGFKKSQKCLDNFPVNFALVALLEGKNHNTCKVHHGEKLIMFCLQDKVKICTHCVLFGEHKSHSMKMINELKAQGVKTRKDLEASLMEFEKNQLERDQELETLKKGFLGKIVNKFGEIKELLREKELEFTKEASSLFERNEEKSTELLLKGEVKKALGEIDEACEKEQNLGVLDQDFSSIISSLKPQDIKEEASKLSNQSSKIMDCMEFFWINETKSIKSFDLTKQKQQQVCIENTIEIKQKPPGLFFKAKTLFTLDVSADMCLFLRVKNANPGDLTINLGEFSKVKRIKVELGRYDSFFQGSPDVNFLYKILNQLKDYTSLAVSFAPEGLTDYRVVNLLNLLFCRIQHLTEIELSFERYQITNQPISFFCNSRLPKATSLKSLTLQLGSTLISDLNLFALAKTLRNLESFTLGIGYTAITDDGIEKVFHSIMGVKELSLQLQGTLVTDHCLNVLGNRMMPCMKNLEKFSLDVSETKITMGGVTAIFTGIPENIRWLSLDFSKVKLSDEVISLFENKVCPKLQLVEDVSLRLGGNGLEAEVSRILETIRKEIKKRKEGCQL